MPARGTYHKLLGLLQVGSGVDDGWGTQGRGWWREVKLQRCLLCSARGDCSS